MKILKSNACTSKMKGGILKVAKTGGLQKDGEIQNRGRQCGENWKLTACTL